MVREEVRMRVMESGMKSAKGTVEILGPLTFKPCPFCQNNSL